MRSSLSTLLKQFLSLITTSQRFVGACTLPEYRLHPVTRESVFSDSSGECMQKKLFLFFATCFCMMQSSRVTFAVDQTVPGAGNQAAVTLSSQSPLVQSATTTLIRHARQIRDNSLRSATVDAISNPQTCVTHRATLSATDRTTILNQLKSAGLVDLADDTTFPGGLLAGVFPPLVNDGTACPQLPQRFFSAPGSVFGGHHSYPGGLSIHEAFNEISDLNLAAGYRSVYGNTSENGLPVVSDSSAGDDNEGSSAFFINRDVIIAAPLWHDWAKAIVFQWNSDGTEFQELNFGGNGVTDSFGASGNAKTGSHHIIGIAEAMKRGLSPEFVITQASAHSTPTLGNEYRVVNWLRAAAMLARIDPVSQGYLTKDAKGNFRLPPLRQLGSVDLISTTLSQTNILVEYELHNLSDADFTYTGPAVTTIQPLLQSLAATFGYNPQDTASYNTKFRNPVLSYLSAERLLILYSNGGLDGLKAEISKLRTRGII